MDGYGSTEIGADNNKSRNYTSFGIETIKLFASTVTSTNSIEAKVLAQLSEDTSYRIRELIASSFQYTRHSKRFKLTCDDVNKALRVSDSQAIYGFSGSKPSKDIHIPEVGVFVTEDKPIDLLRMSESIINKSFKVNLIAESPQYRIDWLNPGTQRTMREFNPPGPDEKPTQEYLQLMKIFNCISKGIISHNLSVFQKTLAGLSKHANTQHILTYLVKFIVNNVAKTNSEKKARQMLLSIRALSKNNYLQVTSDIYVTPLVKSILHCILRNSHDSSSSSSTSLSTPSTLSSSRTNHQNHHQPHHNPPASLFSGFSGSSGSSDLWNLKSFAASILIDMFKEWSSSFIHNKFYNQIIRALVSCIRDPQQSYASHYGAIVTFNHLGFDCIINHLCPHINTFLENFFLSLNNVLIASSHDSYGAQQVIGALINLAIFLLRKFREKALSEDNFQFSRIAKELLLHFGDSLAIQLPTDYPSPDKVYIKKPPVKIKASMISGDELLDVFYEDHPNPKSSGADDDDLSSIDDSIDGKSNESEKDFKRHDGADLLVQSTISDPSLGVKLTIKKIRRQRRSIDDLESLAASLESKRKWKRPRLQNFMQCFADECKNLLSESRTRGHSKSHQPMKIKSLSAPFQPTPWYLMSKKLPIHGKRFKMVNVDNPTSSQWRRKLFSCTLNTSL